jgi:hypothetical protein
MVTTPTYPLNQAHHSTSLQLLASRHVAAKNQKYAAPTHVDWKPVLSLRGPIRADHDTFPRCDMAETQS